MHLIKKIKPASLLKSRGVVLFTLGLAAAALLGATSLHAQDALGSSIKSRTNRVQDSKVTPETLALEGDKLREKYTSPVFETDFEFNALAPKWEEKSVSNDANRHIEVRVSSDSKDWTEWIELEAGLQMRDDAPNPDLVAPETPLFIEGNYFQYRIELKRSTPAQASPEITDLEFDYIDSRKSRLQSFTDAIKAMGAKVFAYSGGPKIVTRAGWGSPDPYGNKYHGTNKYWEPTYNETEQVFLHHTATASNPDDPEAVVRAIWEYHANSLGWGDIGYNYVLDQHGNIYEGRFGGNNVTAGHVRHYNRGSMGVSVLGCFQPDSSLCEEVNNGNTNPPTNATINSLENLLSWKTTGFGIDPQIKHNFCNNNGENCATIPTIAGHRDAHGHDDTSCNGQYFYDMLSDIRQNVANQNTPNPWGYAAEQLNTENIVQLRNEELEVTMKFINKGTATWENTGSNRLVIRLTNPDGSTTKFQGSGWIDDHTPAVLNEASVAPGETGSFTFNLSRPTSIQGRFFKSFKLVSEGNVRIRNNYSLSINAVDPNAVYRLYSPDVKRHFFTKNENERDHTVNNLGFNYEGVGFRACTSSDTNTAPVYRLYHPGIKKHFFTRSSAERDKLVEDLGYSYEGVAWRSCDSGSKPVYRLYNHHARNHFYTKNTNERDDLVENHDFQDEGTGFWAK